MSSDCSSNRAVWRVQGALAALVSLVCFAFPASSWAGRAVRVYEVDIQGEPSANALQEAMQQVLVRATGRREAASDPALAGIVSDAARYVQSYRPGDRGETQVVFDSAALEQAITTAGRAVWQRERPFTIVVLHPPLAGAAAEAARSELEQAAAVRGLPVSLVPLGLLDATGQELSREALLQTVQRLGGDAVLIGRGDSAALNGQWQWTLQTDFTSDSWTGPLAAGVHGATDAIARVQDATFGLAEIETLVEVQGVVTLSDYAAVERLFEGLPGVRRAAVSEVDGTAVVFSVTSRGGADSIDRALAGSARLERAGVANARLVYQYLR